MVTLLQFFDFRGEKTIPQFGSIQWGRIRYMKIYKFDCVGRVPSSIADLDKCEMCQNEHICIGLSGGIQTTAATQSEDRTSNEDTHRRYPHKSEMV